MKKSDFKDALRKTVEKDLQDSIKGDRRLHSFKPKFNDDMKKLCKKAAAIPDLKTRLLIRRFSVAAILLFMLFFSSCIVPQSSNLDYNFKVSRFGGNLRVEIVRSRLKSVIKDEYYPEYIPEGLTSIGCELTRNEEEEVNSRIMSYHRNGSLNDMFFCQTVGSLRTFDFKISDNNFYYEYENIKNRMVLLIETDKSYWGMWLSDGYYFELYAPKDSFVSRKDFERIIASVTKSSQT